MRERELHLLWEAAFVAGGLVAIGLTLHLYPAFEASLGARPHFSAAEADRQIDSAKAYLTDHPDDIDTYTALTIAYYQKGPDHYVEAMNALDKARALGATSEHLFFYAGVMYDALGLPDYAINEYAKYLRHHPRDYETMIRLANLNFRQKHYDEAQALYQQALHAWPKDATAWFNFAILNKEKGNYPVALNCLERVIHLTGQLPEGGHYEEGEIYRLKGDETRADQLYQEELVHYPDYIPALTATEMIFKTKGDIKQARVLQKRIAELKRQQTPAPSAPVSNSTLPVVTAMPVASVVSVPPPHRTRKPKILTPSATEVSSVALAAVASSAPAVGPAPIAIPAPVGPLPAPAVPASTNPVQPNP